MPPYFLAQVSPNKMCIRDRIPVSHNYHVRGYIAIHVPLSVLTHEKESYLLPYYITLIALAVLGLLFVAANWLIVYYPLRRLRKAAGDYAIGNFQTPISLEPVSYTHLYSFRVCTGFT